MDRLRLNLNFRTAYLIFFLSVCFACSSEKKFHFISFEAFILDRDSYLSIDETDFLYLDTTLYSPLMAKKKVNHPIQLTRYSIHANDVFTVYSEDPYEDVRELLRNIPPQVYDFLYKVFGFTRKSMSIDRTVLIHHNKAYIEVHNNGTHVGLVITLSSKKVSLGIAYVLTS